jgi:hypothetical protein
MTDPAKKSEGQYYTARAEKQFAGTHQQSWQKWFGAEWQRIGPVLAARARHFADVVFARGATRADHAGPGGDPDRRERRRKHGQDPERPP